MDVGIVLRRAEGGIERPLIIALPSESVALIVRPSFRLFCTGYWGMFSLANKKRRPVGLRRILNNASTDRVYR